LDRRQQKGKFANWGNISKCKIQLKQSRTVECIGETSHNE
jgi:hypothetical protein